MSLWIPVTLAAAVFQTLRFMLQRQLSLKTLTATGATFARFLYSAPLVVVGITLYLNSTGQARPTMGPEFWIYGALGGASQVLATIAVVLLFKERNFAVGVTFKNTEAMQAALVGLIVLGDSISLAGFGAIALGVFGVLLLSVPPDSVRWRLADAANRAAGLGLAAGLLFAFSGVFYRGASLALDLDDPLARAGLTLAAVTSMQMIGMALWLSLREPGQIHAVVAAWRVAALVGLLSMAGSFCWFTAFTLQNAAYVKTVGQVELILSLLATTLVFRERIARREWIGMGVLLASVLVLIAVL
ncbi:MAG: EamA family transporter [Pseudomonadota bacterium]